MEEDGLSPEVFQKLVLAYKASVPLKLKEIEATFEDLEKNKSRESLEKLRLFVHKMAGNAGSFGFGAVTDLCKGMDQTLSQMLQGDWKSQLTAQFFSDFKVFFSQVQKEFFKS